MFAASKSDKPNEESSGFFLSHSQVMNKETTDESRRK